jgi:hypothetical protein
MAQTYFKMASNRESVRKIKTALKNNLNFSYESPSSTVRTGVNKSQASYFVQYPIISAGLQYGSCFMMPSRRPEFWKYSYIFGKSVRLLVGK